MTQQNFAKLPPDKKTLRVSGERVQLKLCALFQIVSRRQEVPCESMIKEDKQVRL